MEEFKKGHPVIHEGEKYIYADRSTLKEGLVIIYNDELDFFHVKESDIKHDKSECAPLNLKIEDLKCDFTEIKAVFTPSPEVYADLKEKEIEESDRRAFAFAVLSKAKKDANHWYKNIQDRL